jgi:tyrosyl-tRNA synthetase
VQKMSKSLGNYIGINEAPSEIFGKVMSISDDLMWRYHELLTDLTVEQIAALRSSADNGERNPRDIKAELAKTIIADFHSKEDANAAEEGFTRRFRLKEVPEEMEERQVTATNWGLRALLVEVGLATSKNQAKTLIEGGGVYIDGTRETIVNQSVPIHPDLTTVIQVGPRRFVRVRGKQP